MGAEGVDGVDAGVQRHFLAEDWHRWRPFNYLAAERAVSLVAYDEDDVARVGDGVAEVVHDSAAFAHARGGDDDHRLVHVVERLAFLDAVRELETREGEDRTSAAEHGGGIVIVALLVAVVDVRRV